MRGRAAGRARLAILLPWFGLLVTALPGALAAQVLDTVESLSREGRAGEARAALAEWWDREAQGAARPELQRAIWLRATLTLDPEAALRDYRRLIVEYPGGPYSDRALLRIAQAAEERGSLDESASARESLVRDHPGSSLVGEARAWLERNREAVARARAARVSGAPAPAEAGRASAETALAETAPAETAPAETAPASVGDRTPPAADPPPGSRGATPETAPARPARPADPPAERSAGGSPEPAPGAAASPSLPARPEDASLPAGAPEAREAPESRSEATTPPASPAPAEAAPPASTGDFAVQLGAFSTVSRARALVERARSRGLDPRLVTVAGSDLVRVRVGRFPEAGPAMDLRERLRGMGMEAIIVQDASRESPLG